MYLYALRLFVYVGGPSCPYVCMDTARVAAAPEAQDAQRKVEKAGPDVPKQSFLISDRVALSPSLFLCRSLAA